ncbi:hypothetical protein E27107_60121 [Elizabethkingia anophelis]|nr:hypothetical protein E27107_60121 [Elizabethkingia anophelis]
MTFVDVAKQNLPEKEPLLAKAIYNNFKLYLDIYQKILFSDTNLHKKMLQIINL